MNSGPTLAYKLVQRLAESRKVESMVFFTGTPHRGKDFGFYALLNLLRPELFDPRKATGPQIEMLREAVIRNNKQNVTDLEGNRLFHAPIVENETYHYSEAEARFYATLTEFIASGKAYASHTLPYAGRGSHARARRNAETGIEFGRGGCGGLRGRLARLERTRTISESAHSTRPVGPRSARR